jgi:pyrroline-5-carboxylate reductase
MKVAFIGGGTMAEAIIGGILSREVVKQDDITVGEPLEERGHVLEQRYGVSVTTSNPKAAEKGDVIVLSIKPQNLHEVMEQLSGSLRHDQAVLSIVAGAKMSTIMEGLGHPSVIRVMPNTPAQIGEGMSLWTCSPQVDGDRRQLTRSMLSTMGEEIYVSDEKYLDMATALSASGPAYVFLFIEALIDAGVHLGLPRDTSRTLALQTVLGSVRLVKETGRHPAELKDMVSSPGGTTVEALLALEEGGLRATIISAVIAAYEKSLELGEER